MNKSSKLPLRFWIVASIALINSVSFTIIIPVLYPYAKQLSLSDFEASLLTTTYAASQFIGTPILGKLSDQLGRKPLLVLSLLGTVVANLLAGFTQIAWPLFAARILDGLTGGNTAIARAVISDSTSPDQRPRAFGIFGAMFRLGFVGGPALSYLAQSLPPLPGVSNLGMSFIVAAGIALIATILCQLCLPETHAQKQTFHLSWQDFGVLQVFQSVRDRRFGRIFVLTFLSGTTFTIFTFAFQPFFLNVLGHLAPTLAIVFVAIGVLGFMTQIFLLEPIRKRFNVVSILAAALAVRGLLFLAMPTFPTMIAFSLIITLFAVANSFPMPLIDAILSVKAPDHQQGEVLGINSSYLSLSNAMGPAIGGLLVSWSYRAPFWITGVLTLLTAWFSLSLRSKGRVVDPSAHKDVDKNNFS